MDTFAKLTDAILGWNKQKALELLKDESLNVHERHLNNNHYSLFDLVISHDYSDVVIFEAFINHKSFNPNKWNECTGTPCWMVPTLDSEMTRLLIQHPKTRIDDFYGDAQDVYDVMITNNWGSINILSMTKWIFCHPSYLPKSYDFMSFLTAKRNKQVHAWSRREYDAAIKQIDAYHKNPYKVRNELREEHCLPIIPYNAQLFSIALLLQTQHYCIRTN